MYKTKKSQGMPNYANGKIYSIRSRSRPDLVYIGSTIRPLSERFGGHRKPSEKCTSKQIIDIGDAYIELIESYPCANIEELHKREGQVQRSMDCVNRNIAGRTPSEYRQDNKEDILVRQRQYHQDNKKDILANKRQYYQDNKEAIEEYRKQYQRENKDSLLAYHKQYYQEKKEIRTCLCGKVYNYGMKKRRLKHYRSQKHQTHIKAIHEKLGLR